MTFSFRGHMLHLMDDGYGGSIVSTEHYIIFIYNEKTRNDVFMNVRGQEQTRWSY